MSQPHWLLKHQKRKPQQQQQQRITNNSYRHGIHEYDGHASTKDNKDVSRRIGGGDCSTTKPLSSNSIITTLTQNEWTGTDSVGCPLTIITKCDDDGDEEVGISPQHLLEGSDARREFIHHQNNIYYNNNSSFNINSSVLFNRVPYYSNPWSTQQTDNYFSYYYQRLPQWQQFRNRSLMNEDKSWSLGEDFEQGYEELSAFVITIPKMPSSHHSQQSVFKGVKAYFNPDFVSDILCPGPSGDLTTILTDDTSIDNIFDESEKIMGGEESTYQCHFVTKNENYIVGIEYPNEPSVKEMIFKKPEVVKKKEKLSFAHRILNDRIHSLDAIRQDSLVTKSLLDLTSYETKNEPVEDDSFDQFDDVQHPLSFDDLGKIYKSISRSQILSNVQCPNVHFHAHPDGSTTIHQHKSCANPSMTTLDPGRRKLSHGSKSKLSLPKGKDNSYEELSELEDDDDDDEVYSSLNDDNQRSPQSMLGPLPVPPKALNSSSQQKTCECSTKDPVCNIEGGIKFNPCYSSKIDLSPDFCDVMMDAVWRAGQSTAAHAGRTKCGQCAQFSRKLQSDMHNMVHASNSSNKKSRRSDDLNLLENGGLPPVFEGRMGLPPPPPLMPFGPYPMLPLKRSPQWTVDRNMKLLAYISIVVLAFLLLIIVIIVLIVFFQHYGM